MSSSRGPKRKSLGKEGSTAGRAQGKRRKGQSPQMFIMDMNLRNELPPVPMPPKWIKIPWRPQRLYNYQISSLEQRYRYRVHMEPTVGLPLHLIDHRTAEEEDTVLDEADKFLLRRETDEVQDLFTRSGRDAGRRSVSSFGTSLSLRRIYDANKVRQGKHWLRKTYYMENNQFAQQNNVISGREEMEKQNKVVARQRKIAESHVLSKSERIEKSFELAKQAPVHQSNKSLKPLRIFSLLPDLKLAENQLYQVNLMDENLLEGVASAGDTESEEKGQLPENKSKKTPMYTEEQSDRLSRSILHPTDKEDESVVSFLLPGKDSDGARSRFYWARDYQYQIKKHNEMGNILLLWDKADMEKHATANDPVYGKVILSEVEPNALVLHRITVGDFDIQRSRAIPISVTRRDYSEDEVQDRAFQRKYIEEGYYLHDMNLVEEKSAADEVEKVQEREEIKDKDADAAQPSSDDSESDEEELESEDNHAKPGNKAREVLGSSESSSSDSDSE